MAKRTASQAAIARVTRLNVHCFGTGVRNVSSIATWSPPHTLSPLSGDGSAERQADQFRGFREREAGSAEGGAKFRVAEQLQFAHPAILHAVGRRAIPAVERRIEIAGMASQLDNVADRPLQPARQETRA